MPAFDKLQKAAFERIEFPAVSSNCRGGIRDHVHTYPHSPGGAPEKLGRKLYEVQIVGVFHDTFPKWPGLYPDKLNALVSYFEEQTTGDLVIPTVGTIKAYAVDWSRDMDSRQRSGERLTVTFREDQSSSFLLDALVFSALDSIDTALADVVLKAPAFPKPGLLDGIRDAANSVLAIKDQANLYGNLLESKILALENLVSEADGLIQVPDAENVALIEALRRLWDSADTLLQDLHAKGEKLITHQVGVTASVGQIAATLYGDASRGGEILALNPIDDAYAVPAGTILKVYAP
jgi:prophage DNA circulation protein